MAFTSRCLILVGIIFSCHAQAWIDTDNDGVPNLKDACLDTRPDVIVMANGCERDSLVETSEQLSDAARVNMDAVDSHLESQSAMAVDEFRLCLATSDGGSYPRGCDASDRPRILFEFAKSNVAATQMDTLARIKQFLNQYPVHLFVVGHTDNIGTDAFNQTLSLKRAQSVRQILVEDFGFAASRFTVSGKGLTQPIADNTQAQGRQLNRRVEFVVKAE